jgi:Calcineurin-like phosphoesterase superfamily domain
MRESPAADFLQGVAARARASLTEADIDWLCTLPHRLDLDDIVFCHASPSSDERGFAETPEDADQRLLAGVDARAVCFGHTHVQFRRKGPRDIELINAGSIGMPWDGDQRAAWALYREGEFELRRTAYDVERAIAAARALGDEPLVRTYKSASR